MTAERPNPALTHELAHAEIDLEQARERVVSSLSALRDEVARQSDWRPWARKSRNRRETMDNTGDLESALREASEQVKPRLDEAKRQLSSWNQRATTYVKENPGKCLLGALALGFVVGKIARRA
jgi:ElaB/YqjD/DUF883 family membrane-anchored ribosome-binding protein